MKDFPHTLKVATVWAVVTLAIFLGFTAYQHQQSQSRFQVGGGGTIEIRRGADGHYHWPGSVDGEPVDFLVDTGASGTAISAALAQRLELRAEGKVRSQTAGGVVVGEVVRADLVLQGGVRVDRARVVALAGLGERPLLGMDVLGKLRWEQRDGVLTIHLEEAR